MFVFTDRQYLMDEYKGRVNLTLWTGMRRRWSTNSYGWFNWIFDTLGRLPVDAKTPELVAGSANKVPTDWDIKHDDYSRLRVTKTEPAISYRRSAIQAMSLLPNELEKTR